MSLFLYTFIFYLSLPFIFLRLLWRSIKAPHYRQRCLERLGFVSVVPDGSPCVWLHTVSVGETIAAKPLIDALLMAYPAHCLWITTMTPTGSTQVRSLFDNDIKQGRILHSYIPYDLPDGIYRFLSRIRPSMAIFMENDKWPNTLLVCRKKNIPTLLINARLSEKSLAGYKKISALSCRAFSSITSVIAQTQADAARIQQLGVSNVSISGNLKSDVTVDDHISIQAAGLKTAWSLSGQKKIIIAASTHRGEDDIIFSAFQAIQKLYVDTVLLIVPRHPERFSAVQQLSINRGFKTITRSSGDCLREDTQVIVGDTMGEMMLFYGASDIAVICGSFIDHGGHNMLEAAAWALPLISGASVYNFATIADGMQSQNALSLVENEHQLCEKIYQWLDDPLLASKQGCQAKRYLDENAGALKKRYRLLIR
jgi:3-deoxy-D-manno-octulosonic-acid transferase